MLNKLLIKHLWLKFNKENMWLIYNFYLFIFNNQRDASNCSYLRLVQDCNVVLFHWQFWAVTATYSRRLPYIMTRMTNKWLLKLKNKSCQNIKILPTLFIFWRSNTSESICLWVFSLLCYSFVEITIFKMKLNILVTNIWIH